MKKVMFLITGLNNGGAENQLLRVCTELNKMYDIIVISIIPDGQIKNRFIESNISVIDLHGGKKIIKTCYKLIKLLKNDTPSILITFMYHANIIGRICGKIAGINNIVSSIRTANYSSKIRLILATKTANMCRKVIVNSNNVKCDFIDKGYYSSEKMMVIENGIDINKFTRNREYSMELRSKYGIKEEDFLWISVGRLHHIKNYAYMLSIFKEVSIPFKLLIVGEGEERNKIESLINKYQLTENIILLGEKRNINELLSMSDAFIMTSKWEGMSNALMEAASCGLPCVVSDVGGNSELVKNDYNGYVIPLEDYEKFGECVKIITKRDIDIDVFSANSRKHIENNFSMNAIINKWIKIID